MNDARRGDPDDILSRIREEEERNARGRLKVFLGAAPGVGKTYTMLEAAQKERTEGADVVVGYVESHGREAIENLLSGMEILKRKTFSYRGKDLEDFDLDLALARRPALILVDELAHTNAPGMRHEKRWQDVMELLDEGIDVWTTMNVQHLESLNDVVAQITGVRVRETLPDGIIAKADEVELVDIPPEALIERLEEGKVYPLEQARRAMEGFFQKGNLLALRELALRRTAEHVDADVQAYRRSQGISATWAVAEHILVCLAPQPGALPLVRTGKRMASRLGAQWTVLHVETSRARLSEDGREGLKQAMRLAERLEAEVVTLNGDSVADEILAFARTHNVTRMLIGKPSHAWWRRVLRGSLVENLVRGSGDIDVLVSSGATRKRRKEPPQSPPRIKRILEPYSLVKGGLAAGMATAISGALFRAFDLANFAMVYLLAVVFMAVRYGRAASIFTAFVSIACFNFFFVPPRFTFAVSDARHVFTFVVMLTIALIITDLTERIRQQAEAAREREKRSSALYSLTRELARSQRTPEIIAAALRTFERVFDGRFVIFLPGEDGRISPQPGGYEVDDREHGAALWTFAHLEPAGAGTQTLPAARALYLPLSSGEEVLGVLGMLPANASRIEEPEERQLLATFCKQTAMALERAHLVEDAQAAELRAETEALRNTLLSSVSHDLRTPLGAIAGAATTLLEEPPVPDVLHRELLLTIVEESTRLNHLVGNLLDMTRLESGGIKPKKEWIPLEEVIGAALNRTEEALGDRKVTVKIPVDIPLVEVDGALIEQVFINILENGAKYTPEGSPLEIECCVRDSRAVIDVRDHGPGLPAGLEERVFEKFFRLAPAGQKGTGLGLAIARGIVRAHGGEMRAFNHPSGGAVFQFSLPAGSPPPGAPDEESS